MTPSAHLPGPAIVTLSSLFPNAAEPGAGAFVRERMFRVAQHLPLAVVAPRPWFPGQSLIRLRSPGYRPEALPFEVMQGIEVYRPRFLAAPGVGRVLDAMSLARAALPELSRLKAAGRLDVLDAHFAWPDGVAAAWLGRRLGVPVSVTLRGTEVPLARHRGRCARMVAALSEVDLVLSVAGALLEHVCTLGARPRFSEVVGNGVDVERFRLESRVAARERLGIPLDAPVLIGVGGLCERKGFHRMLEVLPALRARWPGLRYLIAGGASGEGDWGPQLRAQVAALGLGEQVHFLGRVPADELRWPLSAADVFVLATRNEGWANVFLEAMACGLPVVTTDVGGNREVIAHAGLGTVVPFGQAAALQAAVDAALAKEWQHAAIRAHAEANSWEGRVARLVELFRALHARRLEDLPPAAEASSGRGHPHVA
jgi:teichuronic acid biosynthesis glycosyltransferase TuaC